MKINDRKQCFFLEIHVCREEIEIKIEIEIEIER